MKKLEAEWISEDAATRAKLRMVFTANSVISSLVVQKNQESGAKFRDFFDCQEPAAKAPSHQLLAMFRGEAVLCPSAGVCRTP